MNDDIELEARPRPLSTGLWTLFSWLRRDDRSDSSDSLSSAGSDRTVASFAFLTPAHYTPAKTPIVLPPPGPPTDSYKKRVHDRNLRRQYDRDITLHRKYGLIKSGDNSYSYDAFSLPPVRRITSDSGGRRDRERRATSECYQRRLAHVPGKRRAPPPPVSTTPITLTTSLTRRSTRKRRAPQPPIKLIEKNKENIKNVEVNTIITQMNPQSFGENQKLCNNDVTMGCKPEKYSKKEGHTKETKVKSEKSFLKQIFDSKKRNSGIDISSVKLLPSISELDKQAAEIIESCKLNAKEQNNNVKNIISENKCPQGSVQSGMWICVSCLRKYNSSSRNCLYCLPNQKNNLDRSPESKSSNSFTQTEKNSPNSVTTDQKVAEEKQKLKEMLKEMKDSLPKRPKHELNNKTNSGVSSEPRASSSYSIETPTLRVGCDVLNETEAQQRTKPVVKNVLLKSEALQNTPLINKVPDTVLHAPAVVQIMPEVKKNIDSGNLINKDTNVQSKANVTNVQIVKQPGITPTPITSQFKDKKDLNTPLKISSLLNPVYVPKSAISNQSQLTDVLKFESKTQKPEISQANSGHPAASKDALPGPSNPHISKVPVSVNKLETKPKVEITSTEAPAPAKKDKAVEIQVKKVQVPSSSKEQFLLKNTSDQHSRRRDLIHQLEQSIAKGDEVAAAEAAVKLAQLRLSCSVLSFSSQILSQPSTSAASTEIIMDKNDVRKELPKNNLLEDKSKKDSTCIQTNSAKVKTTSQLPVNNTVTSKITSNGGSGTSPTSLPASKAESPKHKPLQKIVNNTTQQSVQEVKKDIPVLNDNMITIAVLVEDREATRGPVHLRIRRHALMKDLRQEAVTSLGLAINLQRWIIGRVLCVDDNTPIISLAGPDFSAPFYLWVVEPEPKAEPTSQVKVAEQSNNKKSNEETKVNVNNNVYTELMKLEQQALVPNAENFECGVCMVEYPPGQGVVLRDCVHIFCKECLSDVVRHCEEPDVSCPAMGCRGMLQEREIRALVTLQDYERWLARGLAAAESGTRNAFHCRTRDCKGWALCEPGVQRFPCPVCKQINCVPCQAIHGGETCEQHRAKVKVAAAGNSKNINDTDDGTRTLLNSLIAKGEALECPECSAIITKKWGCDWVKCSACKTEICWVTRGRRWGPAGKGDTSGGCRCGIDGKRCHPSCGYCH